MKFAVGRAALVAMVVLGCGKPGAKQGEAEQAPPEAVKGDGHKSGGGKTPTAPAVARPPEHPVFSLVDNRLSAHPQWGGGLLIPAGSAGFAKYMRFGRSSLNWDVRAERDGIKVAGMKGKTGRIIVPLSAEQVAGTPTIRFRVYSDKPQRLGLRLNGKRKDELSISIEAAGFSTIEAQVPAGVLDRGENEVLFFASASPLQFEWMQFGGTGTGDRQPTYFGKGKLALAKDNGAAYYVAVPANASVVGNLTDAGCEVEVVATDNGGKKVSGALRGKGSGVELGELAGAAVRLELTARQCEQAEVEGAALVVPGPAPALKRGDKPKHVVLLIIDSLRGDRLKPINPKARPEVPTFEELATKATVFRAAYVQGNESRASHASLWTSSYPVVHKMIPGGNAGSIDTKWHTIDELMAAQGMFDFGVSANGYITPKRGFGTKWNVFRNHIHDGGGLTAEQLLAKVWEILAGKEKEPWFGYIGFIDTHVSWRAKEPWISRYMDPKYDGRFKTVAGGKDIEMVATGKIQVSDADKEQVRALYDSNVSYQDQQLGVLLAKLEELGIADETMIIITADHGDELFEAGRVGHGASLRESLVHVPLVVYYPKLFPAGILDDGAEVIDIVPTLADIFGAEMDEHWQGESLLPVAQGADAGYPRMSFASKYEDSHVGRIGAWKIHIPGAGTPQLYKVDTDPDEEADVVGEHPVETRMLSDAIWMLRAYNAEWKKWKWGNPANVKPAFAAHFGE